jgi:hypothetical protein
VISLPIKPESEAKMPVEQIATGLAIASAFLCLASALMAAATAHAPPISRVMVVANPQRRDTVVRRIAR